MSIYYEGLVESDAKLLKYFCLCCSPEYVWNNRGGAARPRATRIASDLFPCDACDGHAPAGATDADTCNGLTGHRLDDECWAHPTGCPNEAGHAVFDAHHDAWKTTWSSDDAKILLTRPCATRYYYRLYGPTHVSKAILTHDGVSADSFQFDSTTVPAMPLAVSDAHASNILADMGRYAVLDMAVRRRYRRVWNRRPGHMADPYVLTVVKVTVQWTFIKDGTSGTDTKLFGSRTVATCASEIFHRDRVTSLLRQAHMCYAMDPTVSATVTCVEIACTFLDKPTW